jgi:hypothetical protein
MRNEMALVHWILPSEWRSTMPPMNLDEALAVHLCFDHLTYPTKAQTRALTEAKRVIAGRADETVERFKRVPAAGHAPLEGASAKPGP